MFLYLVYIDNGLEYSDYQEEVFVIAAYSPEEAIDIARDLYLDQYEHRALGEIYITLLTETDNKIPIGIIERK